MCRSFGFDKMLALTKNMAVLDARFVISKLLIYVNLYLLKIRNVFDLINSVVVLPLQPIQAVIKKLFLKSQHRAVIIYITYLEMRVNLKLLVLFEIS